VRPLQKAAAAIGKTALEDILPLSDTLRQLRNRAR
jgi:hypothetical protein